MSWLLALLNTLAKFLNLPAFLNFIVENGFIVIAYFTLLIEVAETFGAMMVTSIIANFIVLSVSITHSLNLSEINIALLYIPQISLLSLVPKFAFLSRTSN